MVRPLALAMVAALLPLPGLNVSRLAGIPFLDGFYFGVLLAGYLWFFHQLRAPGRLLALVAISGGVCLFAVSSTTMLQALEYTFSFLDDGPGPDVVPFMLAGAFGATLLGGMFLALASRTYPLTDLAICAAAGAGLGALGRLLMFDGLLVARMQVSTGFLPVFIVWQSGMAFVMAVLAEPSRQQIKSSALAYSTMTLALAALGLSWTFGRHAEARTLPAGRPQVQVIEPAPSTENLPAMSARPLADMLIRQVGSWSMQGDGTVQREREQLIAIPGQWAVIDQLVYRASYAGPDEGKVFIAQYPTKAWARHQTRNLTGVAVRPLGTHDVLADSHGPEYYWLSGDMMICVHGRGEALDTLATAYLQKFPSEIDPAFPLFQKQLAH